VLQERAVARRLRVGREEQARERARRARPAPERLELVDRAR
jgi:hypothetical protein